ncbi:MAG: mannose-6-phosphate isomerase-like protein (cupin superfamily) [Paraglaciecola sp.]|jgi:mannose-6-phosphate isomerase-like protein (cupin superfamily)
MIPQSINVLEKFSRFTETWTPKIIGELNGQHVKLAKLQGDFVWHDHKNEDELFLVFKGNLIMDLRDANGKETTQNLKEGELIIIPKGMQHRPWTNGEIVLVLLFEPNVIAHTGDVVHKLTKTELEKI